MQKSVKRKGCYMFQGIENHTNKFNVVTWRCFNEAGSLIQDGSPIQAGVSRAFVLVEAGGLY